MSQRVYGKVTTDQSTGQGALGTIFVPVDTTDVFEEVDDTEGGTTILEANADRQYLLVINQGPDGVYVRFDGTPPTAAMDGGRYLASGEGHEYLASGGVVPKGEILAICATDEDATVFAQEG